SLRRWRLLLDSSRRSRMSALPERARLPLHRAPLPGSRTRRADRIRRVAAAAGPANAARGGNRRRSRDAPHWLRRQTARRNGHLRRSRRERSGIIMLKWPRLFLIAAQFLTRCPMPRNLETDEKELGQAAMFFPLVAALVGAGGPLLPAALLKFLPPSTCALLTLVYLSFITNAFHEDGLADAFDGFGGGWTRERALEIMRDSRVGTFGALALVFL